MSLFPWPLTSRWLFCTSSESSTTPKTEIFVSTSRFIAPKRIWHSRHTALCLFTAHPNPLSGSDRQKRADIKSCSLTASSSALQPNAVLWRYQKYHDKEPEGWVTVLTLTSVKVTWSKYLLTAAPSVCPVMTTRVGTEGRTMDGPWTRHLSPAMALTWVTAARVDGTTLRRVFEQGINEVGKDD